MLIQECRPKTFEEMAGQELNSKILKAIIRKPETAPRTIILAGAWGCGKCVLPTTRVMVGDSYPQIASLLPNAEEGFTQYSAEVDTMQGSGKAIAFYKQSNCKVNLLRLTTGYTINGTDKHRVLAYKNGKKGLIPTKDLEIGDIILFPKRILGAEIVDQAVYNRAYAIGLWLGDGFARKDGGFGFCGTYEMCEKFAKLVGITGAFTKDNRRENLYAVKCKSTDSPIFYPKYSTAETKRIPEEIFHLPAYARYGCLQGLCETDGSINSRGDFEITSKSKDLMEDMQELLLSVGVVAYLSEKVQKQGTYYRLRIRGNYADYCLLEKNGRRMAKRDSMNDRNILPVDGLAIAHAIREFRKKFPFRFKEDVGARAAGNVKVWGKITERTLIKMREFYGSLPEELEGLIGYEFVSIVAKDTTVSDVYDLTVDEVHNFFAQGTYNHNTSSARLFAKALNCESNRSKPCGVCPSCLQDIDRSTYYSEYDSSAMGNVDAIRELRDTFYYSPGKGYKVVVLDECHLMSRPAQSALLKVFEEAPARTFFILATTDVDKILPTIRSRSLELTYTSVSKADMVKNLLYICDQRGWTIPEDILDIIYKKSQGHMRNAHMLLDQFIMVGEEDFRQFVRSSKTAYLNYFKSIATKDKNLLFQSIDELSSFTLSDLKMDFQQVLLELVSAVVGYGSPDQRVIELVRQLGADTIKLFKSCCADWVLTSFTYDETMKACLLSIWQLVCKQSSTGQVQQSMYDRAMKR